MVVPARVPSTARMKRVERITHPIRVSAASERIYASGTPFEKSRQSRRRYSLVEIFDRRLVPYKVLVRGAKEIGFHFHKKFQTAYFLKVFYVFCFEEFGRCSANGSFIVTEGGGKPRALETSRGASFTISRAPRAEDAPSAPQAAALFPRALRATGAVLLTSLIVTLSDCNQKPFPQPPRPPLSYIASVWRSTEKYMDGHSPDFRVLFILVFLSVFSMYFDSFFFFSLRDRKGAVKMISVAKMTANRFSFLFFYLSFVSILSGLLLLRARRSARAMCQ